MSNSIQAIEMSANRLRDVRGVRAVDVISAEAAPSGSHEIEVVVGPGRRLLPDHLTRVIAELPVRLDSCCDRGEPPHKRVVLR